jgi:hypothetical protein
MWRDCLTALVLVTLVVFGCEAISPQYFFNDDIQAALMPGYVEVGRIWRSGRFPLLSECSWCTPSLAGEYQYGIFNPVQQLALIVFTNTGDLGLATAAIVWFFSWITVWGCLRLGRSYGLDSRLALAFAILFCFNRYNLCVGWRAWLSMAVSAAWLPWFWECCRAPRLSPWRYVTFLYLILSSGYPFTVLAAATLIGYHMALELYRRQWKRAVSFFLLSLCGLALGALSLTMLLEYSGAGFRPKTVSWDLALDFENALSYVLPGLSLYSVSLHQINLNVNIGWVPCLGILGIVLQRFRGQREPSLWWLAALWFGLAASPSLGGFRISSRWLEYLNPVMGLIGLLWLQQRVGDPNHRFGRVTWGALLLAQILGPAHSWARNLPMVSNLPAGLFLAGWCLVWNRLSERNRSLWVPIGVLAGLLAVSPPVFLSQHQYPYRSIQAHGLLQPERTYMSLYSRWELKDPRPELIVAARFGSLSQAEGLRFLNSYSPIFPVPLMWTFHLSAIGSLEPDENGVSVIGQSIQVGNLLDKLGVTGILLSPAWKPLGPHLQAAGWKLQGQEGLVEVWHRDSLPARPVVESLARAEVAATLLQATEKSLSGSPTNVLLVPGESGARDYTVLKLRLVSESRQKVRLEVPQNSSNQPALIAIRLPWVQGFRAFLNGQELPVRTLDIQLMGVELPPGSPAGSLEVVYWPRSLSLGLILGMLGIFGTALLSLPRVRLRL